MNKTIQHSCESIRETLVRDGLWGTSASAAADEGTRGTAGADAWRIAPHPYPLSKADAAFFEALGQHLLAFYRSLNRLYGESIRGSQPPWVAAYLDQGKPESLISYARMKRLREHVPGVIRPDIIPTDEGMIITELDSVPGGMGLTGGLARAYAQVGTDPEQLIGGPDGMIEGFAAMLQGQMTQRSGTVAIIVSEESRDYRPEMTWMASRLREAGLDAFCVDPREVRFTEEALMLTGDGRDRPVAVVYRFFELFDLKNVPKSELIMYSAKKERVTVTPPFKPALEEKLAFALFHHPVLEPFWRRDLGEDTYAMLAPLLPHTWILDPRPVPPAAVIPGLRLGGRAVAEWRELAAASQRDRRYVVKPSGFSELAWGSRGVSIGHDLSQQEWARTLDDALASFDQVPWILQEFRKGRQVVLPYHDARTDELVPMSGRARLSPYYFVSDGQAKLAGILATVCPLDKKLIHGMRDAIMVPCSVQVEDGKV